MSKYSSAKYYKKNNKKRLQKTPKSYQDFSEEEKNKK